MDHQEDAILDSYQAAVPVSSRLLSRRTLLRGVVITGVGGAGTGVAAVPAYAASSQNGWPGITSSSSPHLNRGFSADGVAFPGGVRQGAVTDILHYVATQFDRQVEKLHSGWCWGWSYRPIRGSQTLSNHASATAIDCNAPRHPLGAVGTFSSAQRGRIEAILHYCEGTVRWGGDYHGRKDEMHFEINVGPSSPLIAKVAKKVGGGGGNPPPASPWPTLKQGSSGFRVTVLQDLLRHRGHTIAVDGVFGSKTKAAVISFQRSDHLVADGIAGPKTWAAVIVTVRSGSRGYAVRGAQSALNAHGSHLKVDGIFGSGSHRAVVAFQSAHKLATDGVVGVHTWGALV